MAEVEGNAPGPDRTRRIAPRIQAIGLPALIGAALVHPLATLLARWDWHADILTPFGLPAVVVSLLALAVCVRLRRFRLAGPLLALAVAQAVPMLHYLGPNPVHPDPSRPERLRVLVVNVLETNANYGAVAALIRRERPDVVGLIEMTPEWLAGLAATGVDRDYPYRKDLPLGGAGMSLWVHRAMPRPELLAGATRFNPALVARLDWGGSRRTLWLVHPANPFYALGKARPEIEALGWAIRAEREASRRAAGSDSTIVVGDMNRTEGSPHFHRFLKAVGLRDSRLGFGRQPSWPSWLRGFRIAIDHAFVSDDLAVTQRRLGPRVGSDHLPLFLELAPAATNAATHADQAAP